MTCEACRSGHRRIHSCHVPDCHLHPANNPGVEMATNRGTRRPVQIEDVVQSLGTRRTYHVIGLARDGRPDLRANGHSPIPHADPDKYRIIEPLAEVKRG